MVLKWIGLMAALPVLRREAFRVAAPVVQPAVSPAIEPMAETVPTPIPDVATDDGSVELIAAPRGKMMSREAALDEFFELMMDDFASGSIKFSRILKNYETLANIDGRPWPEIKGKSLSAGLIQRGCSRHLTTKRLPDGSRPTIITFPEKIKKRRAA